MSMISELTKTKTYYHSKEVKQLMERFYLLVESKRTQKLLQQDKKIVLFELAYELKNMVNTYGKIAR